MPPRIAKRSSSRVAKAAQTAKVPVVIAVDVGSTAARIAVNYISKGLVGPRFNTSARSTHNMYQYEKGALNASINISDSGPVWVGDSVCASSVQLPVKFLVGNGRGIDDGNPLVAELRRNEHDPRFRKRCRRGVRAFMEALAREIDKLCEMKSEPLEVRELGLSVPAHWTVDEDARFKREVENVFPVVAKAMRGVKIAFVSEIECIAHYICHKPTREEDILGGPGDKYVLFLDFGGHSLNGCIFFVRSEVARDRVFFRIGQPFGVVGGTAQWEAAVSAHCTDNIFAEDDDEDAAAEIRNNMMQEFKRQIMVMGGEPFEKMNLWARAPKGYPSGEQFSITIEADEATRFFQDALRQPLNMAKEKITELKKLSKTPLLSDIRVVVSGGSAKNLKVQNDLEAFCRKEKVPPPQYVYETSGPFDSFKVAEGAAIAVANHKTLRSFIRDGAAFGLQMLQGDGNDSIWDSQAPMLLASEENGWEEGWSYTFDVSGTDRLRIICDPFWEPERQGSRLDCRSTYDLLDLLVPEKGRWRYTLCCRKSEESKEEEDDGGDGEYREHWENENKRRENKNMEEVDRDGEGSEDEDRLVLIRERLHADTEEVKDSEAVELKLEFDRNGNCFLVDPEEGLQSLHCGLGLDEKGKFVALTENFEARLAKTVRARRAPESPANPPAPTPDDVDLSAPGPSNADPLPSVPASDNDRLNDLPPTPAPEAARPRSWESLLPPCFSPSPIRKKKRKLVTTAFTAANPPKSKRPEKSGRAKPHGRLAEISPSRVRIRLDDI